jgi:hypothetical protein
MTTRKEIETFLDSIAQLEPEEQVRRVKEMMKDPTNTTAAYSSVKLAKWIRKHEADL